MTIKQVQLLAFGLIVFCIWGAVAFSHFIPQSAIAKTNSADDILKEAGNYRLWTRITAEPQEVGISAYG